MNKMEKFSIKNRHGLTILGLVNIPSNPVGLVIVSHGLGSWKERPISEYMAKPFFDNDYVVVRYDATNSYGESDGHIEKSTTTNYYEDLEDIINWAKEQNWYKEPFYLTGHSLGGICTGLYAENYPEKVKGWVPVNSVISGELNLRVRREEKNKWKEKGYKELIDWNPKDTKVDKLPWSHMEDRLKYDLLPHSYNLNMPVLIIASQNDRGCPPEHSKLLFDKLPSSKKMVVLPNAPHTLEIQKDLNALYKAINNWIKELK